MFQIISRNKILQLDIPKVMGILNVTDDSFFAASRSLNSAELMKKVEQMVEEGADIIDIGGQSTRPGSIQIGPEEEWKRIQEPLNLIRKNYPEIWISIDTYHSSVASNAIENGADMINDISGGEADSNMFQTVAQANVTYICMHMLGTPETMQVNPNYDSVVEEVLNYLKSKIIACKEAGICSLILDQGYGFGKSMQHNYELLSRIDEFTNLGVPLLVGISRKSMIYKFLETNPENALNGTTVLHTYALLNGASILRVHDVKEAKETVDLITYIQKQKKQAISC